MTTRDTVESIGSEPAEPVGQVGATSGMPAEAAQPVAARAIEGRSPLSLAWERLRRDRLALISFAVIVLIALLAIFAPVVAHLTGHGPFAQDREIGLSPNGLPVAPSGKFLFGTDDLGRDILVRIAYGARISLFTGVVATMLAIAIGVVIGLTAGYFGGIVDTLISRVVDIVLAFPFLVFALAVASLVGPSLTLSILIISFFSWASVARIVRGQVLSVREKEYVEAARSLGAGDVRIMFRDVLPNVVAPIIVYSTLLIPTVIVFEATLSFLGLGVPQPTPDWGGMLDESISYYQQAWWFVVFPGLALLITTLAFNLLGDGVRDAFDPRSERLMSK